MAVPDFYAKVGETLEFDFVLTGRTKIPQDLTLATAVLLTVREKAGTGAVVVDREACTFVPDVTGRANYRSAQVITFADGWYELDVTAVFAGGVTHKFPNKGSALLHVSPKLA